MSKFKMRDRPKKPARPEHVSYEVGNFVTVGYMLECIEKFKIENPGRTDRELMVDAEENGYTGSCMFLTAPPQSQTAYEIDIQLYRVELKSYKAWQMQYKTQIKKHKAAEKKATAKRKLERTKVKLLKEMEAVAIKLEKA